MDHCVASRWTIINILKKLPRVIRQDIRHTRGGFDVMLCHAACHDLQMHMFLVLYKPSMAAQVGVMLVLHVGRCWSETRSDHWQPSLWFSSASPDIPG